MGEPAASTVASAELVFAGAAEVRSVDEYVGGKTVVGTDDSGGNFAPVADIAGSACTGPALLIGIQISGDVPGEADAGKGNGFAIVDRLIIVVINYECRINAQRERQLFAGIPLDGNQVGFVFRFRRRVGGKAEAVQCDTNGGQVDVIAIDAGAVELPVIAAGQFDFVGLVVSMINVHPVGLIARAGAEDDVVSVITGRQVQLFRELDGDFVSRQAGGTVAVAIGVGEGQLEVNPSAGGVILILVEDEVGAFGRLGLACD